MTRKAATPIDIYFHMTNHYRKLQNVKSVVDTSPPTGYKLHSSRESRLTSRNESRISSANSSDSSYTRLTAFKKNNTTLCPSARSHSLPVKPTRRRVASATREEVLSARHRSTYRTRSSSVQVNSPKMSTSEQQIIEVVSSSQRDQTSVPHQKDRLELEYVKFSLRIIEDIISNDLRTNKQIQDVFNSHIEANRECLDAELMMQQVNFLISELKIPDQKDGFVVNASKKQVNCAVSKKISDLNCECDTVRNPPLCYRVAELTDASNEILVEDDEITFVKQDVEKGSSRALSNVEPTADSNAFKTENNINLDKNVTIMQVSTEFLCSKDDTDLHDNYKHLTEYSSSEVHKEDKLSSEIKDDKTKLPNSNYNSVSTKDGFVFVPGPLYIPKHYLSEASPAQNDIHNISITTPTISKKDHYLLITKNIAVNTDNEKLQNCEVATQVDTQCKVTSTETDNNDLCNEVFLKFKNIDNRQNKMPRVDLNYYDLTPQRDLNVSINKIDTKLLLDDKYEIAQNEIANIDTYTNALPTTLNQFYPTNCIQTSSDCLVPFKAITRHSEDVESHFVNNRMDEENSLHVENIFQSKHQENFSTYQIDRHKHYIKSKQERSKLKSKEHGKFNSKNKATNENVEQL